MRLHPLLFGPVADTYNKWVTGRTYSGTFMVCDTHTATHCLPYFLDAVGLPPETPRIVLAPGEPHKQLDTCTQIWTAMFEAGLDRGALVVNLGGGVIGDMGGFCAATYKRGIDFIQVPTTLLAATDASVGGKLGIDFNGLKNAVGVFQNPAGVLVDPAFFASLPQRELHSGFAEVVKHALIGSPTLWQQLKSVQALDGMEWEPVLKESVGVKIKVVEQDPTEKGLRAILNFGHTIGHALESYFLDSDDPLTHGEAVAWGMVCELALQAKLAPETVGMVGSAELAQYFEAFYPKRTLPKTALDTLWALMHQDKKNIAGQVKMALPGKKPLELVWLTPTQTDVMELF